MIKYNINNYMYIKITDFGKELIINKFGYSYFENCVEKNKKDNGYYQLQCHHIMNYFGEHIYNGCKLPFEPIVYLDEKEIELWS